MHYKISNCQQLNQFYKNNRDKARAKPNDFMYAAVNDEGKHCSVLRLLPYEGFLFLRSVLTDPQYRGSGVASALINHAIEQHTDPIYTLPTPLAVPLYQRLGFTPVPKQEIPEQLSASYRRFRQGNDGARVMVINSGVG